VSASAILHSPSYQRVDIQMNLSKIELRDDLHQPRGCGTNDLAVVRIFHLPVDCGWTIKLCVIERIECLGS
jgi:hypothetical protein